ncbi:2-amino-4-hydroxy-6-hydroxymethyldihydropteridine diphosphokinase [Puerhibacterium sp. TATVAM-FAB25]|uniref:2-amino-4-hydroxy-6- hydroxymethyldihydropteridine diphosphokinase n=1 Tax=Puerhibacterium sp. TATVAM-FAB25 TaxID=3093699 RepID=UPI00397E2136
MTIFATPVAGPDGLPLDQVRLTGVTATGHHGVFAHEREEGQEFRADVVLHLDTRHAAAGDDLGATVSYADVAEDVHAVLAGSPADLVETVAERIAAAVLTRPAVVAVDVRVHKPQAPITVPFQDVDVAIRRDRVRTPVVEAFPDAGADPLDGAEPLVGADPLVGAEPLPAVRPGEAAGTPVPAAPAPGLGPAEPRPVSAPVPVPSAADRLDTEPVDAVDVVLAIGANLGDPQTTLRQAVVDLDARPGLEVVDVSPLARTAAVGGPDQPDYLNAVVLARTTLSARGLLRACQAVENAHGRVREEHWGPRTLDVDVVAYGALVAADDELEVPHPRAHERAFVLVPWTEVQPDAVLPGLGGGPVARLAETAPDRAGIRWMALDWLTEPTTRSGMLPAAPVEQVPAEEPFDAALAAGEPAAAAEEPFDAAPAAEEPVAEAAPPGAAEPYPGEEPAADPDDREHPSGATEADAVERGETERPHEPLVTGVPASGTPAAPRATTPGPLATTPGPLVEESGILAPRPFVEPVGRADDAPPAERADDPSAEHPAAPPAPWELPADAAPAPTERPHWAPVHPHDEPEAPRAGTAVMTAVEPADGGAPPSSRLEPADPADPEGEDRPERADRAGGAAGSGTPDGADAAR